MWQTIGDVFQSFSWWCKVLEKLPHFFSSVSVIFSAANHADPDWILWQAVFGHMFDTLGLNGCRKPKLWFKLGGIVRFFMEKKRAFLSFWRSKTELNYLIVFPLRILQPSNKFQEIHLSSFMQAKKAGVHSNSLSGGITSITTRTWLIVTLSHSFVLVSRHCLASMASFEI